MQGRRPSNEDAHCVASDACPGMHGFAIFDGHRGAEVAVFAAQHLPDLLEANLTPSAVGRALRRCFHGLDSLLAEPAHREELLNSSHYTLDVSSRLERSARLRQLDKLAREDGWYPGLAGSTALAAVVEAPWKRLVVANAGDSRAVLCRAGQALALSTDHTPSGDGERRRIEAAGSRVGDDGYMSTPRSFGGKLSVSRGLGDKEHKWSGLPVEAQAVTAEPELRELELRDSDAFVLLACDGVWDVMTSEEAVAFVSLQLGAGASLPECTEALLRECFDLGSTDNMTALLLRPSASSAVPRLGGG
eukprot:1624430-Prymnesium_polylepis.2